MGREIIGDALILDIGDSFGRVVPIIEDYVLEDCIGVSELAGGNMTN